MPEPRSFRFSFEGIVRFRCRSRRHIWTDESDAQKCCDARYKRCVEFSADGSIARFYWLDLATTEEQGHIAAALVEVKVKP